MGNNVALPIDILMRQIDLLLATSVGLPVQWHIYAILFRRSPCSHDLCTPGPHVQYQMAPVLTPQATLFKRHTVPPVSSRNPKMTPRLPQELVDKIIEFVAMRERNTKMQDLKSCSLTAKSWSHASQRYILEAITISFDHLSAWASGEYLMGGISSYVQTLTLCGDNDLARRFPPGCIAKLPAFAKLECLTLKKFCLHSGIEHIKLILKWFRLIGGKLKTLNLDTCSLSPNAFQSILRRFPLLDNVSIDECLAVVNTEGDSTLKPPLSDTTNFRGSLDVGTNTPEEFLSCLLTAPLHFSHLVYDYSREGYQILSACASTLQILILEGTFSPFI